MTTELMSLFDAYNEADMDLKQCQSKCDYDADYFCASYQEKKDDIAAKIDEALRKIIRSEINK